MLRKVKLYGELADFVGYKELDAVIELARLESGKYRLTINV